MIFTQDEEIWRLEAELDAHRQTMSEQAEELDSRRRRIEHLKLMVEKFRQMIFGKKSEKLVLKLEQMEFELEEDETSQAEAEAMNGSARRRQASAPPELLIVARYPQEDGHEGMVYALTEDS